MDSGDKIPGAGPEPARLTALEALFALLDSKGVSRKCVECGQEKWAVVTDNKDTLTYEPAIAAKEAAEVHKITRHSMFAVHIFCCRNCGYMKAHSKRALDGDL